MMRPPGQRPAFPTPLASARPPTPATYVPWLPALLDVSAVPVMTFQPGTTWPPKSDKPDVFRPVSSTATMTDGSPVVMPQASVVRVCFQPHAPPPTAYSAG